MHTRSSTVDIDVTPLRQRTLARHARRVAVPGYDRRALEPAVVHLGVGCFHRSHQAVYLDDLAQNGVSTRWGVVGVGLRSREMKVALSHQDGLYTVIERGEHADRPRVIGAMRRYLFAPDEPLNVLDALADPRTRMVTLTVTGTAYGIDSATGTFDPADPAVTADLRRPQRPGTVLGYLVEALDRRRRSGRAPFTVVSCDNLMDNGAATRTSVVAFARMRDERLAAWIEANVAFPSTMVDRITPQTTPEDRSGLRRDFGVDDRWPVVTEPFSQWIVEDTFANGRPPLEEVGVQLVGDVRPYALMKTRLLNASHLALAYLGALAGHRRIDQAMGDPLLAEYVRRLMDDDVTPLLETVPGIDLAAYKRTLLRRFAHPTLGDRLERLGRSGSTKIPAHVLPSIAEARRRERPCELLTLAVAGWLRHLRGTDELGRRLPVDDPLRSRLGVLARRGGSDPSLLLAQRPIFGGLGDDPVFAASLRSALEAIDDVGVAGAVQRFMAPADSVAA